MQAIREACAALPFGHFLHALGSQLQHAEQLLVRRTGLTMRDRMACYETGHKSIQSVPAPLSQCWRTPSPTAKGGIGLFEGQLISATKILALLL